MFLGGKSLAAYEPRAAQGMGLGYATSNREGWDKNGVPTEKRLRKLGLKGYHI